MVSTCFETYTHKHWEEFCGAPSEIANSHDLTAVDTQPQHQRSLGLLVKMPGRKAKKAKHKTGSAEDGSAEVGGRTARSKRGRSGSSSEPSLLAVAKPPDGTPGLSVSRRAGAATAGRGSAASSTKTRAATTETYTETTFHLVVHVMMKKKANISAAPRRPGWTRYVRKLLVDIV